MKAIKIIGIILLILIILILVIALFLPKELAVERTVMIKATDKVVFDQVNCIKNWEKWSPWQDSLMTNSYEGPECGVGAKQLWEHKTMGNGTQTITESTEAKSIKTELDFGKMGKATSSWLFEQTGDSTKVTWGFLEPMNYPIGRWAGLLFVKGAMIKSYDTGLANLKKLAESLPPPLPGKTGEVTEKTIAPQHVITILDTCKLENIDKKMSQLYGELAAYLKKYNLQVTGMPFAAYPDWDPSKPVKIEAGFPVSGPLKAFGRIKYKLWPGGKVVMATHYGAYETVGITHTQIQHYIQEKGLTVTGATWETYLTDPAKEPDQSKWVTEVYYPVK
jgi:effector-binding domain-containing protein/ribosome-associated toxin RatA of RatAB toxin-antitoxin module